MVRVRVRGGVVVHVEKPVVQVLAIVAPGVEARVRRVEVPVIARVRPNVNANGTHRKPRYRDR